MVKKIGAITIGQSPRSDVVPDIQDLLGNVQLVEAGALDGLTYEEILSFTPQAEDYVLVTKLRDGRSVKIAERYILERLQKRISAMPAEGAEGILMLCSGEFPTFSSTVPLLYPQLVLQQFMTVAAQGKKLGVVNPDTAQAPQAIKRWSKLPINGLVVEAASPYGDPEAIRQAAVVLKKQGVEIIVLDCIGFTRQMRQEVAEITGVPVVIPRTVAARAVAELFG